MNHLTMAHAAIVTAAGDLPNATVNKAGVYTIVGAIVTILIAYAGFAMLASHKNISIGDAMTRVSIIGIAVFLIAASFFAAVVIALFNVIVGTFISVG